MWKRRSYGFSGFITYSSCYEMLYFKDVFDKHSFSFIIFHGRMQGSFTKTIEQKVMPTMSRSISNIIGESFASLQSKMDEVLTQVAQNSSNTTQRDDEDSVENKQVHVLFLFFLQHYIQYNVLRNPTVCKDWHKVNKNVFSKPSRQIKVQIIHSALQGFRPPLKK